MWRPAILLIIFVIVVGLAAVPGDQPARAANESGLPDELIITPAQSTALTGPQPWVLILCKFQDVPDEPYPLAYFQNLLANSYPGLDHYWREVSYNTISLEGSTVVGWYTLPNPKSYYVYDQDGDGEPDHDHSRTATDCTAAADAAVNYTAYYGVGLIFNDGLNEPATGGTLANPLTLDGKTYFWPMIWIPGPSASQGVIAHEIGHTFGLGHIYVKNSEFASGWDLMGSPCYYGSQRHPTYGCVGLHINAATKEQLGWIPAAQTVVVTPGMSTTITLERLALPQTDNPLLARIPINGSPSHYYSVEARHKAGYDDAPIAPESAVLIFETRIVTFSNGQQFPVVEQIVADPSNDPSGPGAVWAPGMTFVDPVHQVTVSVIEKTASGYTVSITNSGSMHQSFLPLLRN